MLPGVANPEAVKAGIVEMVKAGLHIDTALTYNNFSIGAGARETLPGPTLRLSLVKGACLEAKDVHNEVESDRYMLVGEVK